MSQPLVERVESHGRRVSVTTYHDGATAMTACLTFRTAEEAASCARLLREAQWEPASKE